MEARCLEMLCVLLLVWMVISTVCATVIFGDGPVLTTYNMAELRALNTGLDAGGP
jgi:hypothetical protein